MVNQILRTHTARIQDAAHRPDRYPLARPAAGDPRRVLKP
jgi:hypothetical protein